MFWWCQKYFKILPKIAPYYSGKIIVFAANALRAISSNNSSLENIRKTGHFRHFQGQDQKLPVRIEISQKLQNPKISYPEACQSIFASFAGFWGSSTHHRYAAHHTYDQSNVFLLKIWACRHVSAWSSGLYRPSHSCIPQNPEILKPGVMSS